MRRIIAAVSLTAALGLAGVAAIALADGSSSIRDTTTTQVAEPAQTTTATSNTTTAVPARRDHGRAGHERHHGAGHADRRRGHAASPATGPPGHGADDGLAHDAGDDRGGHGSDD